MNVYVEIERPKDGVTDITMPSAPSQHTTSFVRVCEDKLTNATPPAATMKLNADPERMFIPTAPDIGLPVAPGAEPTPEAEGATTPVPAAVPAGWVEL